MGIKACCQEKANLYLDATETVPGSKEVCYRCRVCNCRHFEVTLDPGVIGIKGAEIK